MNGFTSKLIIAKSNRSKMLAGQVECTIMQVKSSLFFLEKSDKSCILVSVLRLYFYALLNIGF